jgi:hypothetical protein
MSRYRPSPSEFFMARFSIHVLVFSINPGSSARERAIVNCVAVLITSILIIKYETAHLSISHVMLPVGTTTIVKRRGQKALDLWPISTTVSCVTISPAVAGVATRESIDAVRTVSISIMMTVAAMTMRVIAIRLTKMVFITTQRVAIVTTQADFSAMRKRRSF